MSITVLIDGRPAEQYAEFRRALASLGNVPDESNRRFEIWTSRPQGRPAAHSVWMMPSSSAGAQEWLDQGGSVLDWSADGHLSVDCLRQNKVAVRVRCNSQTPLDPTVLAAFLVHDFPLVDALMLARAYRGDVWPTNLADYPVPIGGPASDAPFGQFPRNAGLYAVVPTSDWVARLAELQVPVVQLRDKRQDRAERSAAIRDAVRSVTGTNTLLFINDHWQSAIEHRAYGTHLGQEDLDIADLNAIRQAGLRLGISTHGIYEMLRAHACKPSYLAMGAIYPTATKSMPTAPQGLRRLAHYVGLMAPHYPLVAIGGIDCLRIADIWATGVDCAAVLRAIVDAPEYRQAAADLLATTPAPSATAGVA
jgi:thiamine-phosphate pyrophosphorylase